MKKLSYLMLVPLLITSISGCNKKKEKPLTDEEIVQLAIKNPVLLLDTEGGIVYSGSTTQMTTGDFFLGLVNYAYSETQVVEISWSIDNADKWTTAEYKTDPTRITLTPSMIFEVADEYNSVITATAKLNDATATTSFKTHMNRLVTKTKTIRQYREGFAAGTVTASENIRFYGYVTGKMDDTYAGVYVNSGDYGIMLYAGKLEAQWNANNLKVGDLVQVIGNASPYNGLFEVKPLLVQKAEMSEIPVGYDLSEPTKYAIPADQFNGTELLLKDNSKVTYSGLRYLGAGANNSKPEINDNKFNPTNHGYIWFSKDMTYIPAYVAKDSVTKLMSAYKNRSGAGTTADPFVYTNKIETLSEGDLVMDMAGGKVYRYKTNPESKLELSLIDMNKRVDYTKGYVADGKFYKDSAHKTEVKTTYGAAFLDAETGKFYRNGVDGEGKLIFVEATVGSATTAEIEVPAYYNYHQGAEADGASLKTMLQSWTIRTTVASFDGYLSWYNGPNLCPIGGSACFAVA